MLGINHSSDDQRIGAISYILYIYCQHFCATLTINTIARFICPLRQVKRRSQYPYRTCSSTTYCWGTSLSSPTFLWRKDNSVSAKDVSLRETNSPCYISYRYILLNLVHYQLMIMWKPKIHRINNYAKN